MLADTPRRTPAWPLLATLGVHLLLAWSWRIAHPPAPDSGGERVFDLVPVRQPTSEKPQPVSKPPLARGSVPLSRSVPAAGKQQGTVADAVTAPPIPASPADPFANTVPPAPAQSTLGDMIGRAKRDALAIDRELRKGKSGVPDAAGTPMERFGQALEAAYRDRGLGVTSETYTAPDGEIIYRFRRAGKIMCRTSGSVGPRIGGAVGGGEVLFDVQGGGGSAGQISCPKHVQWKRD